VIVVVSLVAALAASVSCTGGKIATPYFNLTLDELETTTAGLPEETRAGILKNPADFLELIHGVFAQPEELTWLVDKTHSLPGGYAPPDLVDLKNYPVKIGKDSLLVRKIIMNDYQAMVKAARADGVEFAAGSTYRSYANQEWLFNYWVKELGLKQAEIESARAGTSQHQLGTTIDFDPITDEFGTSPAYKWLAARAWEFGFTLSYPDGYVQLTGYKYEPWHWRYIGKAAAQIYSKYFGSIQQYWLEFWLAQKAFFAEHIAKR
jgi:zinc D-Ala-D-Ala carboxypeptidase